MDKKAEGVQPGGCGVRASSAQCGWLHRHSLHSLDFWQGSPSPASLSLRGSGPIRDVDFGMGNGTHLGASGADFRPFFNESRKPTKSGRSPLAAFYVRLLREGHVH